MIDAVYQICWPKEHKQAAFMISMQAQPELSEATQIRLVLDGNDEAFCDLVKPHRRDLYLKALSIVRNEADAEEVAQNAVRELIAFVGNILLHVKFYRMSERSR